MIGNWALLTVDWKAQKAQSYQIRLHRNDINGEDGGNGGDGLAFVPTIGRGRDKGQAVAAILFRRNRQPSTVNRQLTKKTRLPLDKSYSL